MLSELKRRRVLQTAAVYVAAAWAATEMLGFLLSALNFPRWTVTIVAILFVLGFPVAIVLAWFFDVNEDGIRRTEPNSAKGRLTISMAVTFLIQSAAGLFYLIYPEGPDTESDRVDAEFDSPDNSIAVLPFVNMSDDPDNKYFSDGVAEELIYRLSMDPYLWVTARTSSFKYGDKFVDVRRIGEELNVAKVLEGSVRKSGNRVRITVQLVNTKDGYHDWSETYDRELTDILVLQDKIAHAVGDELVVKMAVARRDVDSIPPGSADSDGSSAVQSRDIVTKREGEPQAVDPVIYDTYLRARQQIWQGTKQGIWGGIELLDEVVEVEPSFAMAWLALAESYTRRIDESASYEQMALEAVESALNADPGLGYAYALKGAIYDRQGYWVQAEGNFKRSIALSPGAPSTNGLYGAFLAKVGRAQRAVELLSFAVERDPLSAQYRGALAVALSAAGDISSAIDHLAPRREVTQRSWEEDYLLVSLLISDGQRARGQDMAKAVRAKHGDWFWPDGVFAAIKDRSARTEVSRELGRMLEDRGLAEVKAIGYAVAIGDLELAYQLVWRAIRRQGAAVSTAMEPRYGRLPTGFALQSICK